MEENSMPISASAIGYILFGIVLFFLIVSAIKGYKRGFKKSLFRFVWVAVTAVILYFVTPYISAWLNEFDLSSYGLNINGEVNNLSDIGVNLFAGMGLQEYMNNSPAFLEFAQNISVAVLNVVLFVLLFWLTKWILGIPYAIIASKVFDKDAKKLKEYKKKVKELKRKGSEVDETSEGTPLILANTNKYRGIGMIFGLLLGLLICSATLFPIVGINSLYQDVYASVTTTNSEEEEVPYLSTVIDDTTQSYINCYEDSIAAKIMTYTGMEFLSNFLFDSMAKVEVNGEGVVVSNEVKVGLRVFKRVMEIQTFAEDFENATQDTIESALTQVKEIFFLLDDSTALYVLGDDLLPYLIETQFVDNDEITIDFGGEDYTTLLKEAYEHYDSLNTVDVANLKDQVEAVLDIAILLNENGLIEPLLNNEVGAVEDITLLFDNIVNATTFSESLVNSIYKITLLEYKFPELVDSLLSSAFDSIGIEGFVSNSTAITDSTLKDSLTKIVESAINLIKSYNDSTEYDFGTVAQTTNAMEYVGQLLDTCKDDLLSSTSYTILVDYLQSEITSQTTDFADLSTVTAELDNVVSWKTELKSIAPLYATIIKILNNNENVDGVEYSKVFDTNNILTEEYDQLYDIGNALQQVIDSGSSKLITNKNIRNILSVLIGTIEAEDAMNEYLNIMVESKTIKDFILDNIWDETENTSSIEDWGNELRYSLAVVRKINTTFINLDSARISAEENTELAELGQALDEAIANTDLVISNKVLRAFLDYFLEDKMSEETFSTQLQELLTMDYDNGITTITVKAAILNNIYNTTLYTSSISSWEDEFVMLKSLFATDFDSGTDVEKFSNIGGALDSLADSNLFKRSIVRQIIVHFIDTQTEGLDAGLTADGGPVATIKNIISTDATYTTGEHAGEYQIKYADELAYLIDLVETATAEYSASGTDSAERVKFYAIGDELNSLMTVSGGVVTEYKSKLLTQTVINQFLAYYINSFTVENTVPDYVSLNAIIQDIPGENNVNLVGITDYRLEFELLLNTVDMMKNSTATLESIGSTLNDVRERNSHFITDSVIDSLVVIFIDSKVDVDWADADEIIANIKTNITEKVLDANNDDYITMFDELSSLKDNFTSLNGVSSKETMESANVGGILDAVRAMTIAGDKYVARDLAVLIINKAKDYIGDEAVTAGQTHEYGEGLVENVLVDEAFEFSTFDVDDVVYQGSHAIVGYYTALFDAIVSITVA